MASGGRLLSVLQHLAKSHSPDTSLKERCGVLQASLYLVASELPIKRLATDLIRHCKLQLISEDGDEPDEQFSLECVAAALLLCGDQSGQGRVFVEDVVAAIILPTLASCSSAIVEQQQEVAHMLFDLLASQQRWELVHLLLVKGATALRAGDGALPPALSHRLASLESSKPLPDEGQVPGEGWLEDVHPVPLHSALLIIRWGLRSYGTQQLLPGAEPSARGSVHHLVQQCMACLLHGEEAAKQAVVKGVLPAVADCTGLMGSETHERFLAAVWAASRYQLEHEDGRSTGLALLVHFPPKSLEGEATAGQLVATEVELGNGGKGPQETSITALLQRCMVDQEPRHRQRAVHVLRACMPPAALETQQWAAYLLLYDVLEEFAPYLIQGAWDEHIPHLFKAATSEGEAVVGMPWLIVLWERGLSHSNPLVQKLVLESLLGLPWEGSSTQGVPVKFVSGVLLQAALTPGAMKGSTGGLQEALTHFIQLYTRSLPQESKWLLLEGTAAEVGKPGVPRTSFQLLNAVLGAVAQGCGPLPTFTPEDGVPGRGALLVSHVRAALQTVRTHQGAAFQLARVHELVQLCASLLPVEAVHCGTIVGLLQSLHWRLIKPGGHLRTTLQAWLLGGDGKGQWLASSLLVAFPTFFSPRPQAVASMAADEVEVTAWRTEADRFARLMLFAGPEQEEQLAPMFACLEEKLQSLHTRPYLAQGSAERALLLLNALLEAAKPEPQISSTAAAAPPSWLAPQVGRLVAAVSEELGLYTATAWRTYWSPLNPSSLSEPSATPVEGSNGIVAPHQFGSRSSKLPPPISAALLRARLALSCTARGYLFAPERNGDLSQTKDRKSFGGSGLPSSPLLSSIERRRSTGSELDSPLAGRRKSNSEASTSGAHPVMSTSTWQFVQRFASTPLPMPKSTASSGVTQAYAETRAHALATLAVTLEALREASQSDAKLAARLLRDVNINNLLGAVTDLKGGGDITALEMARWSCIDSVLQISEAGSAPAAPNVLARLLLSLVDALQSSHESSLQPLLRCIRHLLRWAISHPPFGLQAASALRPTPPERNPGACLAIVFEEALQACWAAFLDARRRPVVLLASFLQTMVLPPAFQCSSQQDARWALHSEGGPVASMVAKLMGEAASNARLMALLSLQLTKLVTTCPALMPSYADVYIRMLLFGAPPSDQPATCLEVDSVGDVGDPGDVVLTMEAIERSRYAEYKYTVLAGRVAAVCGVQRLEDLSGTTVTSRDSSADASSARLAGESLWHEVFQTARKDHNRGAGKFDHQNSEHGRRKVRLWQAACSLVAFVPLQETRDTIQALFQMLSGEFVAPVKATKETMLTFLLRREPELIWTCLLPRLQDYANRIDKLDTAPSAVLVAAQLLFDPPSRPLQQQMLAPVFSAVLPWGLIHHQAIRAYSQLLSQAMLEHFPGLLGPSCSPELRAMADYFETCPSVRKLDNIKATVFREVLPGSARVPSRILSQEPLEVGNEDAAIAREAAPITLMDRVLSFLAGERAEVRAAAVKEAADVASPSPNLAVGEMADLQRKIQPHGPLATTRLAAWEEAYAASLPREAAEEATGKWRRRPGMVVVASLLEKVPNLGGLCRTCEVFQAESLVVDDLTVAAHPDFTAISVTAEQHVPMQEVKIAHLPTFLEEQRKLGYAILGLEQTAEAKQLPGYDFPQKSVLVLGREKEGIPSELLHLLDETLVIPQLGVIRSLNAHVSASIALFEYTKHFLSK